MTAGGRRIVAGVILAISATACSEIATVVVPAALAQPPLVDTLAAELRSISRSVSVVGPDAPPATAADGILVYFLVPVPDEASQSAAELVPAADRDAALRDAVSHLGANANRIVAVIPRNQSESREAAYLQDLGVASIVEAGDDWERDTERLADELAGLLRRNEGVGVLVLAGQFSPAIAVELSDRWPDIPIVSELLLAGDAATVRRAAPTLIGAIVLDVAAAFDRARNGNGTAGQIAVEATFVPL